MPPSTKTVAQRITPVAIQTGWDRMWEDKVRRDIWHAALKFRGRGGGVKRYSRPFATEAEALAYAEERRQEWIEADRMPESLIERQ